MTNCQELYPQGAKYTILTINISNVPVQFKSGQCWPNQCSKADLSSAGGEISKFMNEGLVMLGEALKLTLITDYDFRVEINYADPDMVDDENYENGAVYASGVGIFVLALLLLTGVGTAFDVLKNHIPISKTFYNKDKGKS